MKANPLTAATAVIALTSLGAMAAPGPVQFHGPREGAIIRHIPGKEVLYNQNKDSSFEYVNSQNYTSGVTADNDQGADDFVVPSGQSWRVTEVDVSGCCAGNTAITENVIFYKDDNGSPGRPVGHGTFLDLAGAGNPNFAISLGRGVALWPGHYWVSVVVNCNYADGCGWGWGVRTKINNDAALWQNPGNGHGTGCVTWSLLQPCFGNPFAGDFMFELQGESRQEFRIR